MSEPVPADVVSALSGLPAVGHWDIASLLLTATDEGIVDVALLSKAEIDATPSVLYLAVASRKARANIARSARATLVVFAGESAATYLALECRATVEHDDISGYAFTVARVLTDDVGVPLQPVRYFVDPALQNE